MKKAKDGAQDAQKNKIYVYVYMWLYVHAASSASLQIRHQNAGVTKYTRKRDLTNRGLMSLIVCSELYLQH